MVPVHLSTLTSVHTNPVLDTIAAAGVPAKRSTDTPRPHPIAAHTSPSAATLSTAHFTGAQEM